MAETTDLTAGTETAQAAENKTPSLSSLKLAQLQSLASQLGITGARRMRKSDLVDAITAHQRGGVVADRAETPAAETATEKPKRTRTRKSAPKAAAESEKTEETADEAPAAPKRRTRRASSAQGATADTSA
ncbi:MAG: Rho termination factor N-terminal domain-containing protein, partial [Rothia sp. (in: high G+C Gram-positive bacteria)]|nr:Rho termination factor N-terminal domain-containing protein [Rothia sp. (in: high G+C Gram-positive bacteria)]